MTMPPASKSMMSPMRLGERGVGGDLDDRRNGVAGGRAQAGGEEDKVRARADLRCHALHVVARRAEQVEAGRGGVLREVEHVAHRSDAALARCACGLDGVGGEAVFDVAGRGIHLKTGVHGLGARGVGLHEIEEALGELIGGAAIDQFLLHAVQFRELGEDGLAAESAEQVGE